MSHTAALWGPRFEQGQPQLLILMAVLDLPLLLPGLQDIT